MMTMNEMSNIIEENRKFLMLYAMERCDNHKENAEELFQETIIKLLINRNKWDKSKGKFTTYASCVMKNKAIDIYRKNLNKSHNSYKSISINDFELDNGESINLDYLLGSVDNEGEFNMDKEYLTELINNLPKHLKIAIIWRIEGYDYNTMEKSLNIKNTTLRANVNRARKILKEKIQEQEIIIFKSVA